MKSLSYILAGALLLSNIAAAKADDFCAGFERGYVNGYKRASGSSLDPLSPLCPLQPLKQLSDPQSDFEQGYDLGFEQGIGEGAPR